MHMDGPAMLNLFITIVGVIIVVTMIFYAMEFRPTPEPYRKFARFAVGAVAFLIAVVAVISLFTGGGGGGGAHVTVGGIIEFAISVIVLFAVLHFCDWGLDNWGVPYADQIKLFLTFASLVLLLIAAEVALIGGGLGYINIPLGGTTRHSDASPVGLQRDGSISYVGR